MEKKSKLLSLKRQQIESIIFFGIFCLYLWFVVDVRLIPNAGGVIARFPVFFCDWHFFSKICATPGGLVDYLSSFLVQFFFFSWAGAVVVTIQSWLIYLFTKRFLKSLNMSSFSILSFVGPVIILALYNRYMYFFNIVLGFLFALVFANLYIILVMKQKKIIPSLLTFLILSLVLYPIAGGSILVFGLLCIIYELIIRSRSLVAGIELLLGIAIPFVVGVTFYSLGINEAYCNLLPWLDPSFAVPYLGDTTAGMIGFGLYLFLPIMSVLLWLLTKILLSDSVKSEPKDKSFLRVLSDRPDRQFLVLIVLSSLVIALTFESKKKHFYAADYYSNHRNWPKAILAAQRRIEHPYMIFIINRALYNMDRLPQDMFFYPQQMGAPFYAVAATPEYFRGMCQGTDFCIDLGLMGHAEQYAWQQLETFGPLPQLLKRLATIRMVKGDMDSARVYLNSLAKTLFHSAWAREYLTKIDSDPDLSSDKYIQKLRSIRLKKNHIIGTADGHMNLIKLLDENKHNKMAFEYLMINYMLGMAPQGVLENLYRLSDFDYRQTPQSFEDAAYVFFITQGDIDASKNFQSSPESHERFKRFSNFVRRYGGNRQAVENEVKYNYNNTYYEYYFHGYKNNLDLKGGDK